MLRNPLARLQQPVSEALRPLEGVVLMRSVIVDEKLAHARGDLRHAVFLEENSRPPHEVADVGVLISGTIISNC